MRPPTGNRKCEEPFGRRITTSLPLQAGAQHNPVLFGAIADCGPDRWGRVLIERAARKKVIAQKPYLASNYEDHLRDHGFLMRARVTDQEPN